MSNSGYGIPDDPPSPELPPDIVIVSYLESIAAADPNSDRLKQQEHPNKYRLASEFNPEIINTILKYAKGGYSSCYYPKCRKRMPMTGEVMKFKACAICRAKAALKSKDYKAKGMDTPTRSSKRRNKRVRITFTLG